MKRLADTLVVGAVLGRFRGLDAADAEDDVASAQLDVLRLACGFRARQGQGLLQGCRASISTSAPATARARPTAWSPTATAHFSYGSCASMINLAAQGRALISVGVIDAMGTEAVIVRPDAGVKTIADLKGKTVLTTANAGVNTFFPLVLKNAGLDGEDVKHHQRAGWCAGLELSAGRRRMRSACWAGSTTSRPRSRPMAAPSRSPSPIRISASTRSATASSRTRRRVKNNPDLVKRFVAGDDQGLQGDREQSRCGDRRDGRHRRRHDGGGPGQGAGARGARRDARRSLFQGQQGQEARPQCRVRLGRHAGPHEEVQRTADRQAGERVLHQRVRAK